MAKYHIGVDVGKSKHKACVRNLYQDSYSGAFSFSVDRQGFEKFLVTLEKLSPEKDDFLIGIEASGNYGITLAHFLLSNGYPVVELNPYRANQFRKAEGRKAKTDSVDARSLARLLSLENHKPLSIPDAIMDNLRELTRFRADLVKDRTSLVNQIRNCLTSLFPEFATLFGKITSVTCLALLVSYPGPQYILAVGEKELAQVLSIVSHRRRGEAMAKELIKVAHATVGITQKQPALGMRVTILGERILALNAAIDGVEREIKALFNKLPYKVEDFPVGDITALATIVAEIEDIHRFSTVKQFLSHFGWCPRTFQSGGYIAEHPRMSHAGNRYVRRIIWMLSIAAIRVVPRYRAYFQHRVEAGKAKMDIIVAVGRKLLSVFYAILKRGIPYDPNWEVNSCHFALARI
ncbi:MAG: IS110 family transposase [Anaerolineales bacterium]|nr:IS110 family transposase [Anaerolineales bacterium]